MDEAGVLAALKRHWEYAGKDEDIAHEICHDDAVLEFPQGRERFVGKENIKAWREAYPTSLTFKVRRIRGSGDLWVVENSVSYGGGPWQFTCQILEFRGDKVARETVYVNEGWEAPVWRAPWRSQWEEETPAA
jgi:hypothetical protein